MSVPATVATLQAYAGDDYELTIPFTSSGSPVDVSGSTFTANLSALFPVESVTLPAALAWSIDMTDAADGVIVLTLDGDALADVVVDASRLYADLRWDLAETGLWDKTLLEGILRVRGQV